MNPFEDEYKIDTPVEGLSSSDVKRRIHVLTERTKFLNDRCDSLEKAVKDLQEAKNVATKRAKKSEPKVEAK